jgi:LytS/YehU family sensor histidine kinase
MRFRAVTRIALIVMAVSFAIEVAANLLGLPPGDFPVSLGPPNLAKVLLCGLVYAISFYLTCALPWIYLGPLIQNYPPAIKNTITAAVGALGASLAITIAIAVTNLIPGVHNEWASHMGQVILGEAIAGAVIASIIGAFRSLQYAVVAAEAKAHEREMREAQMAEAAAKAQSAALQSQINPHFFFNTLNTLAAVIPPEATCAQEIVGRLADMFRYTLACSRARAVTLNQELEFTENYLRLEQARFRERLKVTLPPADFGDILLPGLSLQPLVENAIKYGVAQRVEGGSVEVAVHRNGASCRVDVLSPNDGPVEPALFFRTGHALENVRQRLKLFAGEAAGVDVEEGAIEEDARTVRVSLVLPK